MIKKENSFIYFISNVDDHISHNDFIDIDETLPLSEQVDSLKEDMLQIEIGERFVIDVGWQPDFDPKGYFVVYAIQDEDWDNPLSKTICKTLNELRDAIEKAEQLIRLKQKIKDLPYRKVEY